MTTPQGWLGHPSGLSTLFFTEMWERFSYYGMRAFLILYMTAPVAAGGLAFDVRHAGSVYGTYTFSAWAAPILGGIVADRLLGQYRSVLVGGSLIALGHFTLALHALPFFYAGLALVAAGTGLLKPNVSTLVGSLYDAGDARRDAGFSIFYMGINTGAASGPRSSAWPRGLRARRGPRHRQRQGRVRGRGRPDSWGSPRSNGNASRPC